MASHIATHEQLPSVHRDQVADKPLRLCPCLMDTAYSLQQESCWTNHSTSLLAATQTNRWDFVPVSWTTLLTAAGTLLNQPLYLSTGSHTAIETGFVCLTVDDTDYSLQQKRFWTDHSTSLLVATQTNRWDYVPVSWMTLLTALLATGVWIWRQNCYYVIFDEYSTASYKHWKKSQICLFK